MSYRYFGPRIDEWARQYSPTRDAYWRWDAAQQSSAWVDSCGNQLRISGFTLPGFMSSWALPECVPPFAIPEHLRVSEGL